MPNQPSAQSTRDVDYRFHVRIPTDDPKADAEKLAEHLERHERDLAMAAHSRGEVRELRWWESRDGAVLSRPEALGSRRWGIGYTDHSLHLRLDVPRFKQYRQWRVGLFRWETSESPDPERQDAYGREATRLICEALDVEPEDLQIESEMVL